jgi:hypothetical protein
MPQQNQFLSRQIALGSKAAECGKHRSLPSFMGQTAVQRAAYGRIGWLGREIGGGHILVNWAILAHGIVKIGLYPGIANGERLRDCPGRLRRRRSYYSKDSPQ